MSRRGSEHYHANIGHIFRKYFTRVEGVRGYYVLKQATDPDWEPSSPKGPER